MSVAGVDTGGGELDELPAVVKEVESVARPVAAFDERGAGAECDEPFGGAAQVGCAGEGFRFGQVGGHEGGMGQELFPCASAQRSAVLAHHDRVDHQREAEGGGCPGDGPHHRGSAKGAGFGGRGRNVLEDGGELLEHQVLGEHLDARNTGGVLDGDEGDYGFAVDAELVKGFEVGLDSGAAAGVGAGNGQGYGSHLPTLPRASRKSQSTRRVE